MSQLSDEWGFSVSQSDPFRIFSLLQSTALEHNPALNIIDLSRGNPGEAFAPGVRAREFASFLTFLDTKFNNPRRRFVESQAGHEMAFLEEIGSWARSAYVPAVAERYLKDLSEFIQRSISIGVDQGFDWSPYDILKFIFKGSLCTGGNSQVPQGELLTRVILTWWYKQSLSHDIRYDDVIVTAGASHAAGTLFKLLGQEGIQYLNPGDKVLVTSPIYTPYISIMESRGLEVVSISLSPTTGEIETRSLDLLKKTKGIKMMMLNSPNNPSGFSMSQHTLEYLGQYAEDQDALIITDETYSGFFDEAHSILDIHPKRTLRIQSISKIERSTGLRFGDMIVTKEANDYLSHNLFKGLLPEGKSFKESFLAAKGAGSTRGEFQNTCFVPGPSQIMGLAHLLLGGDDRKDYCDEIEKNTELFTKILSLPHEGCRYYLLFDLNELEGTGKSDLPPEQKILELAKLGVIVLPANLFFSKEDRKIKDRSNMVRICLANADPVKIERAAKLIREYITS